MMIRYIQQNEEYANVTLIFMASNSTKKDLRNLT